MENICIIRNAEAESNSGLLRVVDAVQELPGKSVRCLTRSRNDHPGSPTYLRKDFEFKGHMIQNDELQLSADTGKGLKNTSVVLRYQKLLFDKLMKEADSIDAVHAFDLDSGLPALMFAKMKQKKFIYHIADFYADSRSGLPDPAKGMLKSLEYRVINQADATIICTEERKAQIAGSKPKRLAVVHNSPVNDFRGQVQKPHAPFRIAYVGHLSRRRFIEKTIEAVKGQEDLQLILAGFGESEEAVRVASQTQSNIEFLGQVTSKEAMEIYSDVDLMFAIYDPKVSNHRFSAPNKVYEAMMLAKPIIVAEGTGVDQMVEKHQMGLVIPFTEEAFLQAVRQIKDQPDLHQEMAENAQAAYAEYAWPKMKERIQNLYQEIEEEI